VQYNEGQDGKAYFSTFQQKLFFFCFADQLTTLGLLNWLRCILCMDACRVYFLKKHFRNSTWIKLWQNYWILLHKRASFCFQSCKCYVFWCEKLQPGWPDELVNIHPRCSPTPFSVKIIALS
jgi:hypothetical protein